MLIGILPTQGCILSALWMIRATTELDWQGQDRIELPLVFDDNGHAGIPVRIHGKDELAYLDTGSPAPAMSQATATAAGIKFDSPKDKEATALAENVSVQVGAASMTLSIVLVSRGMPGAGLVLGEELFSKAVVDMDFGAGRLTLIRPETFKPPADTPMPVKLSYSRPTVKFKVNGRDPESCAIIDTGYGFGLALNSDLVARLALPSNPNVRHSYTRADGTRHDSPALFPLDEVIIGGWIFRDVPAVSLASGERLGDKSCGNLVGMNILARHHVIFDMRNDRIWLLPR
ncbi:MAG TPA: aspartyl protease family protein [Steroidobacteraceae bacterium]|nr:aspartyl protease family protein [Steroidobacteraceae bacterium]